MTKRDGASAQSRKSRKQYADSLRLAEKPHARSGAAALAFLRAISACLKLRGLRDPRRRKQLHDDLVRAVGLSSGSCQIGEGPGFACRAPLRLLCHPRLSLRLHMHRPRFLGQSYRDVRVGVIERRKCWLQLRGLSDCRDKLPVLSRREAIGKRELFVTAAMYVCVVGGV